MNLKHVGIGTFFIIVGAIILSPIDEILFLIPLSIAFESPEIIPVIWVIGALCLGIGIVLIGKSFLYRFGFIGRAVAKHPVVLIGSIIIVSALIYMYLTDII